MGLSLLSWVWVWACCCGLWRPWVAFFFFLGVDGRLWVVGGGGVRGV